MLASCRRLELLRRYIRISFPMQRLAYVASLMFRSGVNVFTALMSPMVPMEIISSCGTPLLSYFLAR